MPDTPDPRLYLAEIREDLRSGYSEAATDRIREQHLPALLAMVEAVLELAVTWRAEPVPPASHAGSVAAAKILRACGVTLDEAISRELPGPVSRPSLRRGGES